MPAEPTYLIRLAGRTYQCRVIDGKREVKISDETHEMRWISDSQFVDELCNRGYWDQVCELAQFGFKALKV